MADVTMNANFDNYTSFTAKFGVVINSVVVDPEVTEESSNPVASSGIYKFVEEEIQKGGKVKDVIVEDKSIVDEEGNATIPLADEETKGLVGEGYGFEVKNGYPQAAVYSKTIFNQLKDFLFISKGTLLNVLSGFQTLLESGKNIKTINNNSILGEGNYDIHEGMVDDVIVNGVSVVEDKIANVTVPTKTSDITNDSDFVTSKDIPAPYDDTEIREEISGLDDKIKELELFKFPNVTIIGTPTINNGQISNFSATSYLKFPFLVDFRSQPFEINMAFTTGTNVVNQENIFDSDFGLAFAIRNSRFVIAISTNGTSWDLGEGVGIITVQPNTTYYIKIAWNGSHYILYYSFDGTTYTADITKTSTSQPYPKQIYIGVGENFATVVNHFSGIVNLNNASLKIMNEIVWQGMDDAGLSTRLSTSLDNLDSDGEQKIKDIASEVAPSIDAVLFTPQTLTNDQKTQAKSNIGIDVDKAYVDQKATTIQTNIDTLNTSVGALSTKVDVDSARIDNIVSAVTVDSEVQDIRVGEDGTTYDSAGAAVRGQITSVKANYTKLSEEKVGFGDLATNDKTGVVKGSALYGIGIRNDGTAFIDYASNTGISDNRNNYNYRRPIIPANLDLAVKSAMCDGKGAEWTDAEKASARARMGVGSTLQSFYDQTIQYGAEGLGQVIMQNYSEATYQSPIVVGCSIALYGNTALIYGIYRPQANNSYIVLEATGNLKRLIKTGSGEWSFGSFIF